MSVKASEISELIKDRIKNFEANAEARDVGTVVSLTDGIVRIYGLSNVAYGEMLEFPGDTFGLALNLEQDSVGAVVLGDYKHISEGDTVKTTGRILEVPVGEELLGRVVDSLGLPIDGKGPIDAKAFEPIEKVAPGVIWRKSVDEPVQTGLKAIDAMVPVGRGQRELIIDALVFHNALETLMDRALSKPIKVKAHYGGDQLTVSLFISFSWLKIRINDDRVLKIELNKVR